MIGIETKKTTNYTHEMNKERVYRCVAPHPKTALVIAMDARLPYYATVKYLTTLKKEEKIVVSVEEFKDEHYRVRKIQKYHLPLATLDAIQILRSIEHG